MKALKIGLLFLAVVLMACGSNPTSAQTEQISLTPPKGKAVAAFAEGCFWCGEHIFEAVVGVDSAVSGYCGGHTKNPTYEEVGGEKTGHAETVLVYYDPNVVSYTELVQAFFASHDPTTPNQQGPDRGDSYRSIAFYQNAKEKEIIEKEIVSVNESKRFSKKVVTQVKSLEKFYRAEEYHQNYIHLHPENPYVQSVSIPRFELFKETFKGKLKDENQIKEEAKRANSHGNAPSLSDTSLVKVVKTKAEWKKVLTPLQYNILREKGTEPSFKNPYWNNHENGTYYCAACHLPLFSSETKFESGTGWPSFFAPITKSRVAEVIDNDMGMTRVEATCARCDGHLGHIFEDGPKPTGLRYCMDSASLLFQKEEK